MGQMVEAGRLSCSVGKKEFDRTLSGISCFSDCDCALVTDLSGDIMFLGHPSVHYFWCCVFIELLMNIFGNNLAANLCSKRRSGGHELYNLDKMGEKTLFCCSESDASF